MIWLPCAGTSMEPMNTEWLRKNFWFSCLLKSNRPPSKWSAFRDIMISR